MIAKTGSISHLAVVTTDASWPLAMLGGNTGL
jgi:hypothetical protein